MKLQSLSHSLFWLSFRLVLLGRGFPVVSPIPDEKESQLAVYVWNFFCKRKLCDFGSSKIVRKVVDGLGLAASAGVWCTMLLLIFTFSFLLSIIKEDLNLEIYEGGCS